MVERRHTWADTWAPCPNCKSMAHLNYCSGDVADLNAMSVCCDCGVHGPYVMDPLDSKDTEFRATMIWNKFVKKYSDRPGLELDRGKILGLRAAVKIMQENPACGIGIVNGMISVLDGTAQRLFTDFDNLTLELDPEE